MYICLKCLFLYHLSLAEHFFPQIFNVKQKENQTSFIIIYANQKNSHEAFKIH